ncbi:hypothetical protein BBP40_002316 [Aspergillus hancockii]|nr:hypothetical protein BBP40_002316 [Aspergillus hancockii]
MLVGGLLLGQASPNTRTSSASTQGSSTGYTQVGTSSLAGPLPSTTITTTSQEKSNLITSTTHPTLTVTPEVATVFVMEYETITVTTTTDPVTDVFTTTSTKIDAATVTITSNAITSTALTSISTISTSAGFTPIVGTFATAAAVKHSETEDDCSPSTPPGPLTISQALPSRPNLALSSGNTSTTVPSVVSPARG